MMKTKISTLVFVLFFALAGNAQQKGTCGTTMADQDIARVKVLQQWAAAHPVESRATSYIPVRIHIARSDAGTTSANEGNIIRHFCCFSEMYKDLDFVFYQKGDFNYIDNSSIADNPQGNSARALLRKFKNENEDAINIFVVNTIGTGAGGIGQTLGYYTSQDDYIVLKYNQFTGNCSNSSAAHEIGHFFDLPHTFYGWEGNPYCDDDATWPVAPTVTPSGVDVEKVDGTNCTTSADGICDTPPDYLTNFCSNNSGQCQLSLKPKDPNGVELNPMENNLMSYFEGCSEYEMTQGQLDVVLASYNSSSRSYIRDSYVPNVSPIDQKVTLTSPAIDASIGYANSLFTWADMGYDYYMVEFGNLPNLTINYKYYIVNTNSIVIDEFVPNNRRYYWRVWGFNEGNSCNAYDFRSDVWHVNVTDQPVSTHDVAGLDAFLLTPNPNTHGQSTLIQFSLDEATDLDIVVTDLAGRLLSTKMIQAISGPQSYELDTDLPQGIYNVTLKNKTGVSNRKLVIK